MGVLESFFKISMVLLLITIGMNAFITFFGYAMTGQNISIDTTNIKPSQFISQDADENTFVVAYKVDVYGASIIDQITSAFLRSIVQLSDWVTTLGLFGDMAFGTQKVLMFIFGSIGAPEAGAAIIMIITAFQLFGAAYLPFAIISAFTGGGPA